MKIVKLLYIIIGGIIFAFGYAAFLIPHRIVPGGVSGIAMILRFLYNTPVGIVAILLNIPLFIIALRILGISFGIKSLAAIIYTNLLIDFFVYSIGIKTPTDNVVLATLYGGILLGLGLGLIFRSDASTGGTDIVGQIFSRYTNLSVGMWIMIVDFAVITMAGVTTRSIELALLGYLALFLSSKVIDLILEGIDYARAAFVVSTKPDKITDQIYERMQRGVTILDGHSPYSREKRPVIFCVITKKETPFFKSLIKKIDENAFVILTDVFEVLGKGFRSRV
ncbi:MAG: YitT family protein [candidate division WOR-3 bacterium]|nr:MAG: YitT family protein [candidate division WOR-3 bacterium]